MNLWKLNTSIASFSGRNDVEIESGKVLFITGPNGVGKSSLLHEIFRSRFDGHHAEILPGHRKIYFENENIDQTAQTPKQLSNNMKTNAMFFSRVRGNWADDHLKSFIKRAAAKEADVNFKITEIVRDGGDASAFALENPSVIRTINNVFQAARLKIQIALVDGQLKAFKNTSKYNIDALSDGERAALLLVCAIIAQERDAIFLIDEPENHLNPAIAGPLISSAIRSRPDLGVVIASHYLELLKWLSVSSILHIIDSNITHQNSPHEYEIREYKYSNIDQNDDVPDDVKQSILGSREAILFVEGAFSSDDRILYGLAFPNHSIVARGGWETVVSNVRALRQNSNYTWISVSGIIDADGRDSAEQNLLASQGIYCIQAPNIENLFLDKEVVELLCDEAHKFFGGKSANERYNDAKTAIQEMLSAHKGDIVYRKSVWQINRLISERKVSVTSLRQGATALEGIKIISVLRENFAKFEHMIDYLDAFDIVSQVPVKNTKIPSRAAQAIGYENFESMKRSVVQQITTKTVAGLRVLDRVRNKLPSL